MRDADRNRDARDRLPGGASRQSRFGNAQADAFGNFGAGREIETREYAHQFFAAIAGRQPDVADDILQYFRNQPEHLIADLMTIGVVELLEVIDIDHQNTERRILFHRGDLGRTEEFVHRAPVGQSGQRIGVRALFGDLERVADLVELLGGLDKIGFECRCPVVGARKLGHQFFDDRTRIAVGRNLRGDLAERLDLGAVVGDRGRQKFFRAGDHALQLVRKIS